MRSWENEKKKDRYSVLVEGLIIEKLGVHLTKRRPYFSTTNLKARREFGGKKEELTPSRCRDGEEGGRDVLRRGACGEPVGRRAKQMQTGSLALSNIKKRLGSGQAIH